MLRPAAILVCLCASAAGGGEAGEGRIVFSSDRSGQWRLWTIRPDGTEMTQLTRGDDEGHDVDPAFSPDGKTVLFSSTRGGKAGVWRVALDRARPTRVCDGDQADWAPVGTRIALRRNETIVLRDLKSGKETTLLKGDWPHCSGPAWSPDGRSIAFACRWDVGNALFVVPAGGGKPRKVYGKKGACQPMWSPDGSVLVYETETHVCTIQPDGTKNRLVTYFGGVQRYPCWSPDGKQIVFCQGASERGPWELYVIPAAGGTPRRLATGGSDMHPDWQ